MQATFASAKIEKLWCELLKDNTRRAPAARNRSSSIEVQKRLSGQSGPEWALSSPIEHDCEHKTSGSVFPAGSTRGATLVCHSVSNREHAFERFPLCTVAPYWLSTAGSTTS
jgi:hypothetical protein